MASIVNFSRPLQALITGGASGIGLGVARQLVKCGGQVAIADLPDQLKRLSAEDAETFLTVEVDVSMEASVQKAVDHVVERFGGLDTLVNSAGVCYIRGFEEVSLAEWDRTIDVNLKGTFLVMRAAMPHLKAAGTSSIVNIASNAGKKGYPLMGAYCASKFGVIGLTQAIAVEMAPFGVRVNAVCPSTISETGIGHAVAERKVELGYASTYDEVVDRVAAAFPLRRAGTVADVVNSVLFLLSDSSSWITGESINVDGGSLAG